MIPNFKEILDELSYRVDGGIPNLSKDSHINHLIDILRENGISDAARLANKARVYFSYLNEAKPKKGDAGLEAAAEKFQNKKYKTSKGGEVSFATAINYGYQGKENDAAHIAAMNDFETFVGDSHGKYGTMEKPKQPDEPAGKLGGSEYVSSAEKSKKEPTKKAEPTKKKESTYQPTDTQVATFKGRKKALVEVIELGFLGDTEKLTRGVGVFEPNEDQLRDLVEVTKKQLKDPSYRLPLPHYDINDEDIDIALGIVENKLGSAEFKKWQKRVTNSGAVDTFLTNGPAGKQRFRDIVQKYLETGGRSAITGKFVPFNRMQLDHHIPYSSAAQAVADKKKKGINTTLEAEKDRLDSPDNWDLMETEINQHKNSLEGNALIEKSMKKLNMSPDEKELKKIKDEIKTVAREQLFNNLIKSFGKGDYSGFSEESLGKLNVEEQQMVAKAWNYWHPNAKEKDTQNYLARDPNYANILKKAGIDVNKPDPHFITRYKAQVGGSRTRSLPKKPELMRKDMAFAMKNAGILSSKKDTLNTDTALAKAILAVQKQQKDLKQRQKDLTAKVKQQKTKK